VDASGGLFGLGGFGTVVMSEPRFVGVTATPPGEVALAAVLDTAPGRLLQPPVKRGRPQEGAHGLSKNRSTSSGDSGRGARP
jgi:hypothetical protein